MNTVVHVESLRKTYGATVAVEELSFDVREGEIFGMVGPNGAGKSTTIECVEGLRRPDRGTLQVLGLDPQRESRQLRERTGIQLQQSNLPDRMKVWEALDLYAAFYPHPADWHELLTRLGLEEKRDTAFAHLSGGQKQRLFIALALLPDPQLVFLDELTTGLDPQARHAIWDLVRDVRGRGKTIFLTTHFMEEAERLCDRVAILDRGRIVALDTPAALIHAFGTGERVVFDITGALPASFAAALPAGATLEIHEGRVTITGRAGNHEDPANGSANSPASLVGAIVALLTAQQIPFRDLRSEQPSLEDVFLSLTGRQLRE